MTPATRAAEGNSGPVNEVASNTYSAAAKPGFLSALPGALRAAYAELGLLVPLCLVALAGGAWIHHSYSELPASYTWFQPFRTLSAVARLSLLPTATFLAYLLGSLARGDRSAWSLPRPSVWRAALREPATRMRFWLRALAALVAFSLDVLFVPSHTWLDALAIGLFAATLVRSYSRAELVRSAVYLSSSAFIFIVVCYWFTVVKALTFVGSFTQRDADIIAFERALTGGANPYKFVAAWAAEHPNWVRWCDWTYSRLFHHMAIAAAFFFGLRDARQRTEYLGALAICYMLGGPLYWLLPAAGPAYFSPNTYSFLRGMPGLSVNWMQVALYQNTGAINHGKADMLLTWSYIACMPSLHMAHETVMLYYARASKLFLALSLAFTLFTALAVVVLGWHYPSDILGGVALAIGAILLCRWQSSRLLPRLARSA